MNDSHKMWLWLRLALVHLALVNCHCGRSNSRRTPADTSVTSLHKCLIECDRVYQLCHDVTPECESLDRLVVPLRAGDSQGFIRLSYQLAGRASVCGVRCANPRGLCDRRCYDAAGDAGSPSQR